MGLGTILKDIFIYKEPEEYHCFELLEDEAEDKGQVNPPEKDDDSNRKDAAAQKPKSKRPAKDSIRLQAKSSDESPQKKNDGSRVCNNLNDNLEKMKSAFNSPVNQDVVIRDFKVMQQRNAFIFYIDGMVDIDIINDYILRQLLERKINKTDIKADMVDYISNNLLAANQIIKETEYKEIIMQVLNGLTALFIEGCEQCILIESRGFEKRTVSTPLNETVIKGPQEAFIENLRTNITLVRRIIRNKDFVTEIVPTGKVNNLNCAIMYIKGITNPNIIDEVKRRI
ncbi:MAG: spore germination protein, partial [Smithella sp.]